MLDPESKFALWEGDVPGPLAARWAMIRATASRQLWSSPSTWERKPQIVVTGLNTRSRYRTPCSSRASSIRGPVRTSANGRPSLPRSGRRADPGSSSGQHGASGRDDRDGLGGEGLVVDHTLSYDCAWTNVRSAIEAPGPRATRRGSMGGRRRCSRDDRAPTGESSEFASSDDGGRAVADASHPAGRAA